MNDNETDKGVLNDMIQINNDRAEGYNRAIDELHPEDEDLKTIFAGMSRQSANYKLALMQELQALGGDPKNEATVTGKIYRAWMDIKVAFGGHNRQTVLNNCEFGEEAAEKAYEMALDTEGTSVAIKSILESQQTELRAAHNHIKELRDSIA